MYMKQSILILGAKGMLGQELVRVFSDAGTPTPSSRTLDTPPQAGGEANLYSVTAWDREDIDVTDEKVLRQKVTDLWPDVIINATAYNAVDLCETSDEERKKAEMLNTKVPGMLADIANTLQSTIVHYSTDYVFDGERPKYRGTPSTPSGRAPGCCGARCAGCSYFGPEETFDGYREYDLPNPLSVYGKTKYEGEREVEKRCQNHIIIRLSKLFGKPALAEGAKRSFFDVMLEKAGYNLKSYVDAGGANPEKSQTTSGQVGSTNDANTSTPSVPKTGHLPLKTEGEKNILKVVDGEKSCFTYAPDLAKKTRELVELEEGGIYHIVNTGAVTWFEAAKKLFEIAGVEAEVQAVTPDAFPRPAKRPSFSVLISKRTEPLRSWEEAVREYLGRRVVSGGGE